MSKQTIALAFPRPADALAESEYQALLEALSETARGRSFLAEHARRSRSNESNILLTAIERIEAQVRPRPAAPDPLHDDVRRVLDDIRTARARIETGGAVPKAEQLNALLDILQRRLGKLVGPAPADASRPATPPAQATAAAEPAAPPRPSAARWLDAPPEPAAADNDASPAPRPAKIDIDIEANPPRLPPVANLDAGALQPPVFEIEAEIKAMVDAEIEAKTKRPAENAEQALAAIMALSEDERLALFM